MSSGAGAIQELNMRQQSRGRCWLNDGRYLRLQAEYRNYVWIHARLTRTAVSLKPAMTATHSNPS